ncbi:MAG: 30S ribosomal protein S8 [Clostridiales bacterium]|nr:30S ribosomal protein S8 [Clostridiales bacterium]
MNITDPIADMLTRIRNGLVARLDAVEVPASNMKKAIAEILLEEGYVKGVKYVKDDKQGVLRITLKYGPDGAKVIKGLKRISKPGLRVYAKKDQVPKVLGGLGIAIISTSRGIMTDRNARTAAVGGEVLAFVW